MIVDAIDEIVEKNDFKRHPRLVHVSVENTDTGELIWKVSRKVV